MPIAAIPLIPYLMSAEDVIYFFYILARVGGLFVVSPLLSNANIPHFVRIFFCVFVAAMLAMTLYPDYRGDSPTYLLPELSGSVDLSVTSIVLNVFRELAIGYLIGYAFSILFEGLLLAGQLVGVMVGFSAMEILDPVSNTSQSIISQIFTLLAMLLILSMDLHHDFIRVTADSFLTAPLGLYHYPYEMMNDVTRGTATLFSYGIKFSAIPLVVLSLVTIGLGYMAKVMPEMNIFMVGFPVKIFIGYYTLIATINYFPMILNEAFVQFHNLATLFIQHIGTGI